MKIPICKPYFGKEEQQSILEPIKTGWVLQGIQVARFEKRFREFVKSKHALAVSSCTTALHLALLSIGVRPGDEIILPSFTWVAAANMIELCNARPVFVDIDLNTFNISIDKIERAITHLTKAILPVSLFGLSADMDSISNIAKKHKLFVIEDDACALGAYYHGVHAGRFADLACFSFHPRKAITTGEGGMIITDTDQIAEKIISLRNHGASSSKSGIHSSEFDFLLPDFDLSGFNYRMTDIQAALGNAQIARLRWILKQRSYFANKYRAELNGLEWLTLPHCPENYQHGYQSFVILFTPVIPSLKNIEELNKNRNLFMEKMKQAGIMTRPGTHAVHMLGYYRKKYKIKPNDYINSYFADQLSIALPLYPQMTDDEFNYIITSIRKIGKNF